jgi:hypothetical protein
MARKTGYFRHAGIRTTYGCIPTHGNRLQAIDSGALEGQQFRLQVERTSARENYVSGRLNSTRNRSGVSVNSVPISADLA